MLEARSRLTNKKADSLKNCLLIFYKTVIYNLKSSAVKLPLIDTDAGTRISGS